MSEVADRTLYDTAEIVHEVTLVYRPLDANGALDTEVPGAPVFAELRYNTSDPAAVRLGVWATKASADASYDEVVRWVISRETALASLVHPSGAAGEGDFRFVTPEHPTDIAEGNLAFILDSPTGLAALSIGRATMEEFLGDTVDEVPPDIEELLYDFQIEFALNGGIPPNWTQ